MTRYDAMIREAICDRLILIWQASGLTQHAFAQKIGVTPTALNNYFTYRRTPSHALIYQICERYQQSPADFYPPLQGSVNLNTRLAARKRATDDQAH